MNAATKTVTVRLMHNASIPGARWCEPVGWEPANEVEGSELDGGAWWDDDEQTAGLVWFGHPNEYGAGEVTKVNVDNLRVASCGDCRVIGKVKLAEEDDIPDGIEIVEDEDGNEHVIYTGE